jgi:hypothetical protein
MYSFPRDHFAERGNGLSNDAVETSEHVGAPSAVEEDSEVARGHSFHNTTSTRAYVELRIDSRKTPVTSQDATWTRTVEKHSEWIYLKLEVASRTAAVARAHAIL